MARAPARLIEAPISCAEYTAIVEGIDAGRSDTAIALRLNTSKPHGSNALRVTPQQIAKIRADWIGG